MVNEIVTKLTQRSFQLAVIGLPLIGFVSFGLATLLDARPAQGLEQIFQDSGSLVEGLVDESGLLMAIEPESSMLAYGDRAAAQTALAAGWIDAYVIIPADYAASGVLYYVRPDAPLTAFPQAWQELQHRLQTALLAGDERIAQRLRQPLNVESRSLRGVVRDGESTSAALALAYGVTLLFYFVIFSTASHNISGITLEKENRVLEILVTAISPGQMFAGKIVGLGVVGLLQAMVWLASSYVLTNLSGQRFDLAAGISLSPGLIALGVLFFVLGYSVYAALLAGVGALAPKLRDASVAAFVVGSPLILALLVIWILIKEPASPISVALSLFPLTSPVVMMTRLVADSQTPAYQVILAVIFLLLTVALIVRVVTGLFRTQILLSEQPLTLGRLVTALRGQ